MWKLIKKDKSWTRAAWNNYTYSMTNAGKFHTKHNVNI